uniref:Hexosyltransferase n=1 Tax=Xenopus tropicalis TaxID=8364 RepID=A0A1B8XSV9_XENTR|eukprot:XP_004920925.1 PREDICTED: beta-1,3-galactosyltransferase 5-like [Xenopus tropicalis]
MAHIRTWHLKVCLCVGTFLILLLVWGHVAQEGPKGALGLDLSPLFHGDLVRPPCRDRLVLLILVTSHPAHTEQRKVIRKTWAAQGAMATYPWQAVFLIGRTLDVELDWHIHKEHVANGDILMGNYLDTYRNLTLKVMHGLQWAAGTCQPRYILKTDDDCFVNTERLPAFLALSNQLREGLYVGSTFSREKRVVIRDPSSKWYVSKQSYDPDTYPPYASGIGYVLSLDVAKTVLAVAQATPPIPMEDAYVGILADRAGIKLLSSTRFAKHNLKWSICNYRYLMVIHRVSPAEQEVALGNVQLANTACTMNKEVTHW